MVLEEKDSLTTQKATAEGGGLVASFCEPQGFSDETRGWKTRGGWTQIS